MGAFYIGALAERIGMRRSTIRYYESIGLLEPSRRTAAGYRLYSDRTVSQLRFVHRAQALGFSLDEIRELLRMHRRGASPCQRVLTIARQRLIEADEELRALTRFRERLAGEIHRWEACPELSSDDDRACALIECDSCDNGAGRDCCTSPDDDLVRGRRPAFRQRG